ncbi:hypothetical protein LXL04_034975 [Taraxacum kok-saghyz]
MRRRQFYSANGFVSGNRLTSNFFSKGRYPHNVALTTYFRLMVSPSKTRHKDSFASGQLVDKNTKHENVLQVVKVKH